MNGRYLLDTNVAIAVLNNELDLEARRGERYKVFHVRDGLGLKLAQQGA